MPSDASRPDMEQPREPPSPRPVRPWETVADRVRTTLDDAVEQGYFDNLPGRGKPLDLSDEDNPFIPDDMRLAYRILRNAGYSLPWIELLNQIEAERARLERDAGVHSTTIRAAIGRLRRIPSYLRESRWNQLQQRHTAFCRQYAESIDALNRKVDEFNLSVPVVSLHQARINRTLAVAALEGVLPPTLD